MLSPNQDKKWPQELKIKGIFKKNSIVFYYSIMNISISNLITVSHWLQFLFFFNWFSSYSPTLTAVSIWSGPAEGTNAIIVPRWNTRPILHMWSKVFANTIWPGSGRHLPLLCSSNTAEAALLPVMTCVSPASSCSMEACDIVLICTLLFSIKGQTVQNSTVIPHTLSSHFTPVFFVVVTSREFTDLFHFALLQCQLVNLWPFSSSKQQIRKLRRELDASQEKVATLTSQLAANVSVFPSDAESSGRI